MRSSNARCLASNGEGGSGAGVDDLLPNSAENGNKLGVWRVSVAGLSFAALSFAALSLAGFSLAALAAAGAGGAALPVFGSGAGTGSGIFSFAAGSAEAEDAPSVAKAIAATIVQHKPIMAWRRIGATAIRPDIARRLRAMIPLPPMRCIRTPRYARSPETNFAKCTLWQIRD